MGDTEAQVQIGVVDQVAVIALRRGSRCSRPLRLIFRNSTWRVSRKRWRRLLSP